MNNKLVCEKGCCYLNFTSSIHYWGGGKSKISKISAGVLIIMSDEIGRKILLTQSYNNLWGVPKGKKERYENIFECASREVMEESGIKIPYTVLKLCEKITYFPSYDKNSCIHIFKYFMAPVEYLSIVFSKHKISTLHNDSTGYGWVYVNCLNDFLKSRKIKLNALTKFLIKKIQEN